MPDHDLAALRHDMANPQSENEYLCAMITDAEKALADALGIDKARLDWLAQEGARVIVASGVETEALREQVATLTAERDAARIIYPELLERIAVIEAERDTANRALERVLLELQGNPQPQSPPQREGPTQSIEDFIAAHADEMKNRPFAPAAWYNVEGDMLEVYWEDASCYAKAFIGPDRRYESFAVMFTNEQPERAVGIVINGIAWKHLAGVTHGLLDQIRFYQSERDAARADLLRLREHFNRANAMIEKKNQELATLRAAAKPFADALERSATHPAVSLGHYRKLKAAAEETG